jgi:hypothetical protein
MVDHIDRNPNNNDVSNLRWAQDLKCNENAGKKSNNTSGISGVSWSEKLNGWVAYLYLVK